MNYRTQKGVTMLSLIVYVACFVIATGVVGSITLFFYNNTNLLNEEVYSAAEYNKLNAYLVKESEEEGNSFEDFDNGSDIYSLSFSNGDVFTFDKESGLLYYNRICLCEDVQELKVETDYSTGREIVKVEISFTNKSYTTSYTMNA